MRLPPAYAFRRPVQRHGTYHVRTLLFLARADSREIDDRLVQVWMAARTSRRGQAAAMVEGLSKARTRLGILKVGRGLGLGARLSKVGPRATCSFFSPSGRAPATRIARILRVSTFRPSARRPQRRDQALPQPAKATPDPLHGARFRDRSTSVPRPCSSQGGGMCKTMYVLNLLLNFSADRRRWGVGTYETAECGQHRRGAGRRRRRGRTHTNG